jgi:hypothetical protein
MKNAKILMLVWLVVTAANLVTSAATNNLVAYNLDAVWTNTEATVWDVNGAPRTPGGGFPEISQSSAVQTDGAGKISGTGSMEITYNSTGVPFSRFATDIRGRISSTASKPTPVVLLTIKGAGFTTDETGFSAPTSLSLKFTGTPGPNPSNPNQIRIVGTVSGTIKGTTPLGEKSAKISSLVALISSSSSDPAGLSVSILQGTKTMLVLDRDWAGRGSIITRTNGYKLAVRGIGLNRGSSLALAGSLGAHTNSFGTNQFIFNAPVTANGKGKIAGQAVTLRDAELDASHISY